jgi:uncharacterized membrane-anchored protein YitT (DUF2179 family)
MSKIVNRTNHTLTLDHVPTDLQGTDVMFMSASGQKRGRRSSLRHFFERLAVLVLGGLVMGVFIEIFIRAGISWGVFGMIAAIVWGGLMGYLLGRDL